MQKFIEDDPHQSRNIMCHYSVQIKKMRIRKMKIKKMQFKRMQIRKMRIK